MLLRPISRYSCRRAAFGVAAIAAMVLAPSARAQEHDPAHADHEMEADTSAKRPMEMASPLGIPMERTGSGTSWLPDAAPMRAIHARAGDWTFMTHGVVFGMYDKQNGPRGVDHLSSLNWAMLMATRQTASSKLQFRAMGSAEPWTLGSEGYPLLLQTGETYKGQPMYDRQHPHDMVMELAAVMERAVTDRIGVSLYAAPVGEPAIGPVAFPHRPSAMNDPLAPIVHHWQDATHVSFGVLTAGVFTRSLRLEASIFNGREPDETRTDFDYEGRSLDSYAARLTWNPSANWSLSGSWAYLASPDAAAPDESMRRAALSVLSAHTFSSGARLNTAFVFGANQHEFAEHLEPSYLAESSLQLGGAHNLFARAEYVQKDHEELILGPAGPEGDFNVMALTAGYLVELGGASPVRAGIGARGSVNLLPASLSPIYGSATPTGFALFVRLAPQTMSAGHDMSRHARP
ncbi:MAG TPA: hypothetical protein VF461_16275 [Gemmatimonadaceae bacterium]